MKTYEAIGVVEAKNFTTALQLVDAMCKASEVELLASEKTLGGRLVTLIVGGSISNVKAAIDIAKFTCEGREELLKMAIVISRPHEEIMKFIISKESSSKEAEPSKEDANNEKEVVQETQPLKIETKEQPKTKRKNTKKKV